MLTLTNTLPSYCAACQRPAQVGLLELKGWLHKVLICASCLRDLAAAIERGGAVLPNGEGR